MLSALKSLVANNLAQKFAFALLNHQKETLRSFSEIIESKRNSISSKISKNENVDSDNSNNSNTGGLLSVLSQKKSQLKPTVTLVREGGCVDGKVEDFNLYFSSNGGVVEGDWNQRTHAAESRRYFYHCSRHSFETMGEVHLTPFYFLI